MFRFPFGTTQELNLDWFLEQWEVFKQEAQTALDGIDHALDDEIQRVEDAMTDLYAARDAAIAAKNNALDYSQSANSSAIGASQSAQNSAASAVTSAQQAQSAAQSAQNSAASAIASATQAQSAEQSASEAAASAESVAQSVDQIAQNAADIEDLKSSSLITAESNIIFIGDSYSTGEWSGGSNTDFVTLAMQAMGHTKYIKKARGGAAFIHEGNTFLDLLNAAFADVEDANSITHIMVFGGSNETATSNEVIAAVSTFKQRANTIFPNARIYIGENGWNVNTTYTYMAIIYKYRLAALRNGISFIDGMYMVQHNDTFKESDGHPNANGQQLLADFLVSYLTGNKTIFSPLMTSAHITLPSGSVFSSAPADGTIFTSIADKNTALFIRTDNMPVWVFTTTQTKAGSELVTFALGSISNSAVHGDQNGNYSFPVQVYFNSPSGEKHYPVGNLNIKQSAITLTVYVEDGWKYSSIRIMGVTLTAPYFSS